ncbi:unnamed protein product [Paramecium sonneborni]|uniref:Transmembrane protein n=1 Tax=Paramecium sonneborni TaxID=65129 RepID=A0A8S1RU74_9CILI|nr:unnamed protein product [Paramecium sonneborni]
MELLQSKSSKCKFILWNVQIMNWKKQQNFLINYQVQQQLPNIRRKLYERSIQINNVSYKEILQILLFLSFILISSASYLAFSSELSETVRKIWRIKSLLSKYQQKPLNDGGFLQLPEQCLLDTNLQVSIF